MKEVLELIESKKQEFAKLPFFQFLQDTSIEPRQRLAFAPCFSPFVMGFAELNRYVWREEPTNDPIQALINQHTYEDDSHWIWFLEDLQKLEFDMFLNLTDALRFLWSSEIQASRQTIYEIYRYTYKATPIDKLVVIEAIEAIADIFLSTTTQVTEELKIVTGKKFKYFGNHHFLIDSDHSMYSSDNLDMINNIQLSEESREYAFKLVDKSFNLFKDFVDFLLFQAQKFNLAKDFCLNTRDKSLYLKDEQINPATEILESSSEDKILIGDIN
ncbi:hypothetical protein [Chlorogloeopsis sp. ULAP02]|uniref:hypothetical protein n=1 Tax=Chlorogloeopsis sp. ULAP02 TaxID=3107926 RepID=UPI0031365AC0